MPHLPPCWFFLHGHNYKGGVKKEGGGERVGIGLTVICRIIVSQFFLLSPQCEAIMMSLITEQIPSHMNCFPGRGSSPTMQNVYTTVHSTSVQRIYFIKYRNLAVFCQEIVFRRAFLLLLQALKGEVGMSSVLDEVARALFNGQIPAIWRRLAPDTLKSLGNWMIHFQRRFSQYTTWVSLFWF